MPTLADAEDGMEEERVSREKTIYFPQFHPVQSVNNEVYMVYQLQGKLALSDECLRVVSGEKGYLLIWPGWYTFDIVSRDIVISNLRTGAVVAQLKLGDTISMSGGELEDRPFNLKYAIPGACKGPYWAVGDIESVKAEVPPKPEAAANEQPREQAIIPQKQAVKSERRKQDAVQKASPQERGNVSVIAKKPAKPERSNVAAPLKKPTQQESDVKKVIVRPKAPLEPTDSELEQSIDR